MNNRLVIYSSKLHRGGAEKHLVLLVNELITSGWEVHLVVSQRGGAYERLLLNTVNVYTSSSSWRSYTLALLAGGITLLKIIKKVRPAISYSIQDGPNIINLLVGKCLKSLNIPTIIEVQNNPTLKSSQNAVAGFYFRLCRVLYPSCSMLICLSDGVKKAYLEAIPALRRSRSCVIHNIAFVKVRPFFKDRSASDQWNLLAIGRLTKQKDFGTLIRTIALVKGKLTAQGSSNHIKLLILGDGELFGELNSLVQKAGLHEDVALGGFVDDVDHYYQSADMFVLSSKWEGFGNVIVEAMSHGLPVISTDCDFGPSEIIEKPGVHGILVPVSDEEAMGKAILQLIADDQLYSQLSQEGYKRSLNFSAEKIAARYEDCFRLIANGEN